MIILDSSVWIAYWNKNDNQHEKAEKVFSKIDNKVVLTEYLVLEICSVLSLRVNKKIADKFLDFALSNSDIELFLSDENHFTGTIKNFNKNKTGKLSFVDCSLLYLSKFYEVITFDRGLKREIEKMSKNVRGR